MVFGSATRIHRCAWHFRHPAAGGRGITVTWNPYRGPLPKWRPAVLAAGTPGIPGTPADPSGRAVLVQPPPGSATPARFSTWVAAVQLWGTDNRPTSAARWVPAEIPPSPTPGAPAEPNGTPAELNAKFGVSIGAHTGFPAPSPTAGSPVAPGAPPTATPLRSANAAVTV
jgi:hypothetical protein